MGRCRRDDQDGGHFEGNNLVEQCRTTQGQISVCVSKGGGPSGRLVSAVERDTQVDVFTPTLTMFGDTRTDCLSDNNLIITLVYDH